LEDGLILIGNFWRAVIGNAEGVVIESYLLGRTEVRTDIKPKVH
jgi:hypothetical protein